MDNDFCRQLYDRLSPDERILKFKSAELNGNVLNVTFIVKSDDYDEILDEHLREKVLSISKEILPSELEVFVRFYKVQADEVSVINKIIEYIFSEHKSVYPIFAAADFTFEAEGDICTITVTLEKYVCEYVRGIDLAESVRKYLETEFVEEIEIAFIEKPNQETTEALPERFYISTTRVVDAEPVKIYIKGNFSHPKYICDILEKDKEDPYVVLCGVISDIKTKKIIKKNAKGVENEKELFTFNLNDTTASIKCKFFAKYSKDIIWNDLLTDNKKIILNGAYRFDAFENKFCCMVNSIAEANINFGSINKKSNFNIDYGRYMYVSPEPYNDIAQNDLFDIDMTDLKMFENTEYVAFDLETTGLNVDYDEIIEIAAIKIINGQFVEKFSTFVKPTDKIPKRITEITGINDEMVINAPTPAQVIQDFYRFTKGCTLIGHNISGFDIPLLNAQAAKVKYEFTNNFIDTLSLARSKLKLSKYKLGDVCEALKVPLIGAHRAINDVAANAKVFLKLMKY